jgi:hypothetical protein
LAFRSAEYPKDPSDSSRSRSDASHGRAAHSCAGSDSGHDNGGGGNFEFHREARGPSPVAAAPFFRQVPSKWNDAEKWIAGRHVVHSNPIFAKKHTAPHAPADGGNVAPESAAASKGSAASCSNDNPSSRAVTELSTKSSSPSSVRGPATRPPPPKRLRAAQAVSMRDVGTEMTPIASQEQSRSGTPAGNATPSLSPLSSVPSSPRFRGALSSASASSSFSASQRDQELRRRTRREIAALGLQLGKMNIASWASKEEGSRRHRRRSWARQDEHHVPGAAIDDELRKKEFEARAAKWEESHKSKLAARCVKHNFFQRIMQNFGSGSPSSELAVSQRVNPWLLRQVSEERGEDTGMGELPKTKI